MVLAVGTGRALRALPKANQPRGEGVISSAKAEGYPASRHGDFPLRRGVMFMLLAFLGAAFRYFLLLRFAHLVSPSSIFLRFEFQLCIT